MFKKCPVGQEAEHIFVWDRIKDMIKAKGLQVVPGDIEGVVPTHPAVADFAVVVVLENEAGECAAAFGVRAASAADSGYEAVEEKDGEVLREEIDDYVQDRLDETHWLHDRIVFLRARTGRY